MRSTLDLNLIGYLVVLAQYPRLSAALEKLAVSRATLNRGLARLRAHYGDDLYTLDNGRFKPTAFAIELVSQLSPSYQALLVAAERTNAFDFGKLDGALRFYAPANLLEFLTPELFACTSAANGNLMLESIAWMGQGPAPLQPGEMAFCVDLFPLELDRDLVQRSIGTIPIGVYLPPEHPLATQEAISISDLSSLTVVRQWSGEVTKYGSRAGKVRELVPNAALTVNTVLAGLRCAHRFGYGMVSARVYDAETEGRLCWRPIMQGEQGVQMEYGFYYHRSWYQHPFISALEGMLHTCHKRLFGS
ncbi:LysR family transcriptional regulator [Ferrimonas balearica]|uniref:LysR family transcriptional regulator n=1 Tax=Ferrimonas balearica TaxID=44012 RepID=UPI001C98E5B5|nr:LysR family transcriptional regulator [Ferrimonas balearica]MBY5991782.1 LysR family transcriptional regulator [Ferrimonas balearica]